MPIIEIDKSVFQEIENVIERRDKMYENQIATTKKFTDSIEKVYEQEVKKLKSQLQQKENIIKEVREYILTHKLYCFKYDDEELFEIVTDKKVKDELLEILGSDKE